MLYFFNAANAVFINFVIVGLSYYENQLLCLLYFRSLVIQLISKIFLNLLFTVGLKRMRMKIGEFLGKVEIATGVSSVVWLDMLIMDA